MAAFDTRTFKGRGYIAPTVYLAAGKRLSTLNYYSTLQAAVSKYLYLVNKSGGSNSMPSGTLTFKDNGTAETIGINCDFFALINNEWVYVSYAYLKSLSAWPPIIFRFMHGGSSIISYAIYSHSLMGLSATKVSDYSADKIDALDLYYRQVQIMQLRYNELASFLNLLAKNPMNSLQQSIYSEGVQLLGYFGRDLDQSQNLFYQMAGGKVGVPILLLIAGIALFSTAAAWSVTTILSEAEKTKRINDAYDLQKWVAEKKTDISAMVVRGELSQSDAAALKKSLDTTASGASAIAANSAKQDKGFFAGLNSTLSLILLGGVGYYFLKNKNR